MATETYQLAIDSLLQTSYRSTVLHFTGVGAATGDTVAGGESLINGFASAVEAAFLNTLPGTFSIVAYRARRVNPPSSAETHLDFLPFSKNGTRGSQASGQQTCPVVFLVPTMGVKSGGKIFWPAIPQGDIASNIYAAGWKSAVDTFIAACVSGFSNGGITWTLCVYSRKLASPSAVAGHNFSPVVGFQSRRRKPTGAVG